jgi:hypothetical protein
MYHVDMHDASRVLACKQGAHTALESPHEVSSRRSAGLCPLPHPQGQGMGHQIHRDLDKRVPGEAPRVLASGVQQDRRRGRLHTTTTTRPCCAPAEPASSEIGGFITGFCHCAEVGVIINAVVRDQGLDEAERGRLCVTAARGGAREPGYGPMAICTDSRPCTQVTADPGRAASHQPGACRSRRDESMRVCPPGTRDGTLDTHGSQLG